MGFSGGKSSLSIVLSSKFLLSRVQASAQVWWDAAGGDAEPPGLCAGRVRILA